MPALYKSATGVSSYRLARKDSALSWNLGPQAADAYRRARRVRLPSFRS